MIDGPTYRALIAPSTGVDSRQPIEDRTVGTAKPV